MARTVAVVDYGMGNLRSVSQAVLHVADGSGLEVVINSKPEEVRAAERVVLPGQGAMRDCMRELSDSGLKEAVLEAAAAKPLMGVCVGMQMLLDHSEEQDTPGLGFIPGQVRHLRSFGCTLRVPHVGWNSITRTRSDDHLLAGMPDGTDFYFVHSYAFAPTDPADVLATTDYGVPVTAAVRRGHVWGTQFHPEKSSRAGFQLLKNFIEGPAC
jgi:glutamine amidotransferase